MREHPSYAFSETQLQSGYIDDFRQWAVADAGKLPLRDAILCVGSSTIRMWQDLETDLGPGLVLNRGFGGSRMADVLPFKDFFACYEAHKVVIYEGDNDLASGEMQPAALLNEFHEFCAAIWARRDDARIYIMAIKPSPRRWHLRETYQAANALLLALCNTDERLTYLDIEPVMLGEDGTPIPEIFMEDELHMTRPGYELWRDAIRPVLRS